MTSPLSWDNLFFNPQKHCTPMDLKLALWDFRKVRERYRRRYERAGLRRKKYLMEEMKICLGWRWKVNLTVITKRPWIWAIIKCEPWTKVSPGMKWFLEQHYVVFSQILASYKMQRNGETRGQAVLGHFWGLFYREQVQKYFCFRNYQSSWTQQHFTLHILKVGITQCE